MRSNFCDGEHKLTVSAGKKVDNAEQSASVRLSMADLPGALIGKLNVPTANRGAGGIDDGSKHGTGDGLPKQTGAEQRQ